MLVGTEMECHVMENIVMTKVTIMENVRHQAFALLLFINLQTTGATNHCHTDTQIGAHKQAAVI